MLIYPYFMFILWDLISTCILISNIIINYIYILTILISNSKQFRNNLYNNDIKKILVKSNNI
jgi:hypothetical protein